MPIDPERLRALVKEHPDWYLREFSKALGVCPQAVQKRLVKMGITRKKKTFTYSEKSEAQRQAYLKLIMEIREEPRVSYVFCQGDM
jgi:predicted transcriptional regulator